MTLLGRLQAGIVSGRAPTAAASSEPVFAESCGLPHNLADVPVQGSHPVAQAIASLIELPFSARRSPVITQDRGCYNGES